MPQGSDPLGPLTDNPQNAGWNFISGSNLNRTKEQRPTSEPAKKPKAKAKKAVKKA
jgi:hypothetical protein